MSKCDLLISPQLQTINNPSRAQSNTRSEIRPTKTYFFVNQNDPIIKSEQNQKFERNNPSSQLDYIKFVPVGSFA